MTFVIANIYIKNKDNEKTNLKSRIFNIIIF